jgi:hypothetical protein
MEAYDFWISFWVEGTGDVPQHRCTEIIGEAQKSMHDAVHHPFYGHNNPQSSGGTGTSWSNS